MAEYAHLSTIDPELQVILAGITLPPPLKDTSEMRAGSAQFTQVIQAGQRKYLPKESEYKVTDHEIDVGDGVKVKARCVVPTPKEGESAFPLFFWIHGGGWVVGDIDTDDYNLRRVAVSARVSIVNCEYRLAPEHPFPAAPNDCFAALKFVASHPELFSADLSKGFIVGGQSAGGNLAAVVAHLARDDPFFKEKPLTGQMLIIPVIISPEAVPEKYKDRLLSYEQNKNAPFVGKKEMIDVYEWYKPFSLTDPKVTPLLLESHAGLPPAYFQVCGLDPLRDEGLLYENVLKEAGVKTKIDIYPGVIHAFESFAPEIKMAKKSRADFVDGLKWLLVQ